jgi:hypothetical protein
MEVVDPDADWLLIIYVISARLEGEGVGISDLIRVSALPYGTANAASSALFQKAW